MKIHSKSQSSSRSFLKLKNRRVSGLLTTILFASSLFLSIASPVSAGGVSWKLWGFPADMAKLKAEKGKVSSIINDGYIPYGISYDSRAHKIRMMFLKGVPLIRKITHWKVEYYENKPAVLNSKITVNINQDWMPMGLSNVRGKIAILFIKIKGRKLSKYIERWDIKFYNTWKDTEKGLTSSMNAKNVPVGITTVKGKKWVFYLKFKKKTGFTAWKIGPSSLKGTMQENTKKMTAKISGALGQKWYPFGVTLTKTQFVGLYLKYK